MHEQKLLDNLDHWHGAELSLIIAGNWQYYRSKVLKYLQLIAVITPYTQVADTGDSRGIMEANRAVHAHWQDAL